MIWSWILVRYPREPHAGSKDPGFVRFRMRSDRTERFIKNYCISNKLEHVMSGISDYLIIKIIHLECLFLSILITWFVRFV